MLLLSLSNRFKMIKQLFFVLALLFSVGSVSLYAAPQVIPQAQASHFCQLLIADGPSVSTLSVHAVKAILPADSLTTEQIFAGYVLLADGWQTMRIFPHQQDGVVSWYSAADALPASMSFEHQKYIREVFPRLVAEVQAGHWSTVDDYIDRMIQYQCQFGGSELPPRPSSAAIIGIILLFFASLSILNRRGLNLFL